MIKTFLKPELIVKETIVKSLFAVLFVLVVLYSLILLSLTGNAITLKKVSLQTKKTDVMIAKSERDFSRMLGELNASNFSTIGFAPVNNSSFAVKKDDVATFSVLYERH